MKGRSAIRLASAEVAAVAINVFVLGLWFLEDYPAETAMLIYAVECGAAIGLAVILVLIASPAFDPDGSLKYKHRSRLISDFLLIALGFLAACFVFLTAFIFLVLKVEIEARSLVLGVAIVFVIQLAGFAIELAASYPLKLRDAEQVLTRSLGKTSLLFVGIFIGVFLAGFVNEWFVLPFILLKTVVDIGEPIQFFMSKDKGTPSSGKPAHTGFG